MDLAFHRQQVAKVLGELESSLERLIAALAHGAPDVHLEPSGAPDTAIRRLCEAYSQINYRVGEEVGSSVVCLGVVGVNANTLRLAEEVNAAKAKLKATCSPLQSVLTRIPVKGETTKAIPVIRAVLRNIQRSDLSLFAAYRKIPILSAPPSSITYTRANTRSVYRKSVDALFNLLSVSEGPAAAADRAALSALNPRESHLALVKERYPNVRANVLYTRLDARGRGRVQITAELPVMYMQGRRSAPPEVYFAADPLLPGEPKRERQSMLERSRYLQSLPVYRYRA